MSTVIVDKTIDFLTVIIFTIIGVAITITPILMPGKIKTLFTGVSAVVSDIQHSIFEIPFSSRITTFPTSYLPIFPFLPRVIK